MASDFELYVPDRELTREQLIAVLAEIPDRLAQLVAGIDARTLAGAAGAGDWSPIETCRHLRDAVQVYGMRFKWMILQDDPFFPDYNENRWVAESPDEPAQLQPMLAEISAFRSETIRLLRSLPSDGWSRRGRHEVLGSVELGSYVAHELAHEEQHLAQLRDALRRSGE